MQTNKIAAYAALGATGLGLLVADHKYGPVYRDVKDWNGKTTFSKRWQSSNTCTVLGPACFAAGAAGVVVRRSTSTPVRVIGLTALGFGGLAFALRPRITSPNHASGRVRHHYSNRREAEAGFPPRVEARVAASDMHKANLAMFYVMALGATLM